MTKQPKFAINQIWLDHSLNTQIISSISTDASEYFPICAHNGLTYTLEGEYLLGVPNNKYGLVKYIGEFVPANQTKTKKD
jgi:hypothetical protein